MKLTSEKLVKLLNLANDFRTEKGGDKLVDLPPSIPNNPFQCIIANAFNYGAQVYPSYNLGEAVIVFKERKDRKTYEKLTGAVKYKGKNTYAGFPAHLTEELNDIAKNFDSNVYKEYEYEN